MKPRTVVVSLAVLLGAPSLAPAQEPATCIVSGIISEQGHPLPGVAVSIRNEVDGARDVSATTPDGRFELTATAAGRFTLTADLFGFAKVVRDLTVDMGACPMRVDVPMTLASRSVSIATAPSQTTEATAAATNTPRGGRRQFGAADADAAAADASARRTGRVAGAGTAPGARGQAGPGSRGPQPFQAVQLLSDPNAPDRPDDGSGDAGVQALLPAGFSPDSATDAAATLGNAQQSTAFFGGAGGPDAFAQRFGFGTPSAAPQGQGGPGPGGFGGGQFGGPGGPGGPGGGPGGFLGRGRGNQIRGSVFESIDSSALDTAPYALSGTPAAKPSYLQQRFGATLGGPMAIPHVSDRTHNFVFLNYTGNHSSNPYSTYATVPTAAERTGNLSALGTSIIDPTTGQPYPGAVIPSTALNPASLTLLNLFPLPDTPGLTRNLHTVTTTTAQLDDLNVRLVHTFGEPPRRPGPGGGGRGGFGGGRGGQSDSSNLNIQVHFRRSDNSTANPFAALNGATTLTAWDVPVSYSFKAAGLMHTLRADVNYQQSDTTSAFTGVQNVAGNAGLLGVSTDPFDFGAPGLAFSSLTSLRQGAPAERTNQTIAIGDTVLETKGQHTVRFGGDYRDIRADSRTDANANGSFVFTGLYTGSDLADFLLGLPQQATVQYGPGLERFRSRSADLFLQDDWRAGKALTVNMGLRYEYYSPVSEASNRLATLDTTTGFTSAVPVLAGGSGPFSGALPDSIVRPFRGGFAPRLGIAWRPTGNTVVRGGYGINYNASTYQAIATQLAAQPPFATTATVLATASNPTVLQNALVTAASATTNTFGVDPNYRLPFVQIYNVDVQHNLSRTVTFDIGYTGTKGTNLDLVSAPDRHPDGTLKIAGVSPFLWESSGGRSRMNALSLSLRKRQSHGFAASVAYTLSKSMDNASSIGGGATVVAQNPQDLSAEWGLSSFDQRHRVTGSATYDLPFGHDARWFTEGAPAAWLGHWQVSTSVQFASGTPFTAQVLGSVRDVATGLNGTLRANYDGEPIALANPTTSQFFNTAAFSVPTPGTYGSAGRNTIIGPGTSSMNLSVLRAVPLGSTRALTIQLTATNVLNTLQFASINTVVNSPTFGQVTSFRPMRTVQVVLRVRF